MDNSPKKAKFIKLAESRTNKAIEAINSISKLANPYNYEYQEQEVKAIFKALKNAIDSAQSDFEVVLQKKHKKTFSLREDEKHHDS